MSIFRNDTLGSWTRGGQAIIHNVRMTTQVFFQTLLAGIAIWVSGTIWYVLEKSTDYQRFVAVKIAEATLKSDVPGGAPLLFRTPSGRQYWTSTRSLVRERTAPAAQTSSCRPPPYDVTVDHCTAPCTIA